jgi:hypothetical protein
VKLFIVSAALLRLQGANFTRPYTSTHSPQVRILLQQALLFYGRSLLE